MDAVKALTKDHDAIIAGNVAANIGTMQKLTSTQVGKLKEEWCARTEMGPRIFNDELKRGKASQLQDEDGGLTDEARKDLADFNKEFCLVDISGSMRIARKPDLPGRAPVFYSKENFITKTENKTVTVTIHNGDTRKAAIGKTWLRWAERREYDRLVFEPSGAGPKDYNIWTGLAVAPKKGDWSLLRAHLLDNICQGDMDNFNFAMTWMGHIVQFPGNKMPSAFVVKGPKGVGKSKLFDWLRKIFGEHALKVNDTQDIVGGFNKHQQGVVIIVAEEAVWAGDIKAGNKLKDIISSDEMLITPKGIDSIRFQNHMRLAMVSNEDWVVPATEDERRYFVLGCGVQRMKDFRYFKAIDEQMKAGGLEAMAYELMHWKPDMFELRWDALRNPPKTPWLTEQVQQGGTDAARFAVDLVESALGCDELGNERLDGIWTYPPVVKDGDPTLEFNTEGQSLHPVGQVNAVLLAYCQRMGVSGPARHRAQLGLKTALPEVCGAEKVHKTRGDVWQFPPFQEMRAKLRG
jgi:hypothetical protein